MDDRMAFTDLATGCTNQPNKGNAGIG